MCLQSCLILVRTKEYTGGILRSHKAKDTSKLKAQEELFSKQMMGHSKIFKNLKLRLRIGFRPYACLHERRHFWGSPNFYKKKKAQKGEPQETVSYS